MKLYFIISLYAISLQIYAQVVNAFISQDYTTSDLFQTLRNRQKNSCCRCQEKINEKYLILQPTRSWKTTLLHLSQEGLSENDVTSQPKTYSYFATCIPGLSQTLAYELSTILPHLTVNDQIQIKGPSGVAFQTTNEKDGFKALYWLRTAHRLLELICTNDHDQFNNANDAKDSVSLPFAISDRHDLYEYIRSSVNVAELLGDGKGGILDISCKCLSSSTRMLPQDLRHLHYTALTVKNALVDDCRDLHPQQLRPNVNTVDPDVPLFLAIQPNSNSNKKDGEGATVSLYRSLHCFKSSLHKRGYRRNLSIHKAAMKESLACGLLYIAGFDKLIDSCKENQQRNGGKKEEEDGKATILDPMMGSGTFLMEAAYLASDVAPGLLREKFMERTGIEEEQVNVAYPPVLRWKDTNTFLWQEVREEALERAKKGRQWLLKCCREGKIRFQGNELDPRAYNLAEQCIINGGLDEVITLTNLDCRDWSHDKEIVVEGRSMVVVNPPWGVRLNDSNNNKIVIDMEGDDSYVANSWDSLETFLKRECSGMEAWVLSGNKNLTKLLKMKRTRSIPIHTGEEDLRWIQYHIFDWKRDGTFGDKGTSAKAERAKIERMKRK